MSRFTKKHKTQTVLALDANYMPMVEMSRRKALKALATGRALGLDPRTWDKLSLLDLASRPLHAIVFTRAKAIPEVKLGFGRRTDKILRRDGYRCQYVGCNNRGDTVDHVKPVCQGGLSTWSNLVACCQPCNTRKGGRTPEQAGMQLKRMIRSQQAILLDRLHELASERN